MTARPSSDELNSLVNALQLCIKSPISGCVAKDSNRVAITFDYIEKNDTNLENLEKILQGRWDKNKKTYETTWPKEYSIADLTQFLILTRMSPPNIIKLGELESRFAKLSGILFPDKKTNSTSKIESLPQASQVIFNEIRNRKMTLRKMADLSGFTQVALSNFKSGSDIRLSNFIKLADALNLKIKIES